MTWGSRGWNFRAAMRSASWMCPGHERFVNNMLAGVGGIDLAMLVVAADESVMPQTREHLAILDLLRIPRGIVALTKTDLVEEDWIELVTADVEDTLEGTVLEGAAIMPVSAQTGEGLAELVAAIEGMLSDIPAKRDLGRPRLPIDRSFTITGFGTVVTGTLIDGYLDIGQDVELVGSGQRTRIRGIQTHKSKVERAEPGNAGGGEPDRGVARRDFAGGGADGSGLAEADDGVRRSPAGSVGRAESAAGTICT